MYCIRITGKRAIEYAEAHGIPIERGGSHAIDRRGDGFRPLLQRDEDWDAPADDGEQVYVDAPAPFAVARYGRGADALLDIEYHQSLDEARDAYAQAAPPEGAPSRVCLVEVDEDGAPSRTLEEKS